MMFINEEVDENGNCEISGSSIASNSEIQKFYHDASILITGATGFIGKALTEKLLRTCPQIESVYLLMRPKHGQTAEERCKKFLQDPVFDRIRSDKNLNAAGVLDKVHVVSGDIKDPNLGIKKDDFYRLQQKITVVFHSAATVRFNESLPEAVVLNTLGAQKVLLFCKKMKKLKILIHVSTAYCNVDKDEIQEKVYPIRENNIFQKIDKFWDESLNEQTFIEIGTELQEKHPNTYTVTKAMAEWVIAENSATLSVGIVRPSIVTAAWREPYEGWIDNVNGITGIMMETGRGTIRSILCDQHLLVDIIPIDFVVNTLITAAWYTATYCPGSVKVYNCTSSSLNPICWEELGALTVHHALKMPSRYVQWYPGITFRTNRFIHFLCQQLFHYFPAFVIDTIFKISGSKPMMMKIYNRFKLAAEAGQFFALHQWNFTRENMCLLQKHIKAVDEADFYVDISKLEWNEYIRNYVTGIRNYILKDGMETIPHARAKLKKLYWVNRCLQAVLVILMFKIIKN